MTDSDTAMMARAMRLAEQARCLARPNPAVGCVLVRDGAVIGEGHTLRAGGPHAEVVALADAGNAEGATAYVTLEPCAHTGRTGPCTQALIDAGVSGVVVGQRDPNPRVSGAGIAALSAAGIKVSELDAGPENDALNRGFFMRMRTGKPWVHLKLAMSLDGRTAMASGESQWITGPEARADVQRLRAAACALMTGIGTVLADDPRLTVRDCPAQFAGQPLRVVLDSRGRLSSGALMLSEPGSTLVYSASPAPTWATDAERIDWAPVAQSAQGLDLQAVLRDLAQRECNEVMVECGAGLAGSLLREGLVDSLTLYVAPSFLGNDSRGLVDLGISALASRLQLDITDWRAVGSDWRIDARPVPAARENG